MWNRYYLYAGLLLLIIGFGACQKEYSPTAVYSGGFITPDTLTITANDYFNNRPYTIHCGDKISMTTLAGNSYQWSPGGETTPEIEIPYDPSEGSTTYSVTVTTDNGTFNYSREVISKEAEALYPDQFSPNGDGKNDYFFGYFFGCQGIDFQIRIFNISNGGVIYESNDVTATWDGTYKGRMMPVGEYPYSYTITTSNGPTNYEGIVYLIR